VLEDRTLDNGFVLGPFRPEDARGIVACYREMYGDDFPMRYVYDPEAIIERNAGPGQRMAVVRDPGGQVAGLAGLFQVEQCPGVFESGQLMVRKRYRRLRLGRALAEACLTQLPSQVGATALVGEATCHSITSQTLAHRFGMMPTGLEVEAFPEADGRRATLLFMFKVLQDRPHALFVPKRYLDFVQASCECLGLDRRFDTGEEPREEPSVMTSHCLEAASLVRCRVRRAGRDFADCLRALLKENPDCLLQVSLNLGDPATPWAADLLREHGFFLGAHLPLWMESDALMLQLLRVEPRPEDIQVMAGWAAEILATVLADRNAVLQETGS
jgi:GNAT superfamily N-acetyltransferase